MYRSLLAKKSKSFSTATLTTIVRIAVGRDERGRTAICSPAKASAYDAPPPFNWKYKRCTAATQERPVGEHSAQ